MSNLAFTPAPSSRLTIQNCPDLFPVRRIYCIGRNYADHAIEMGHNPDREPPFFFQKNPDNADQSGQFPYPPHSSDVHFEAELIIALHSGGRDISLDHALDHVFGYAAGLDMTRRDLQGEMKKMGRPWEIGKAFERSAPMGPIVPADQCGHLDSGTIALFQNDQKKQDGNLNQMIWKVPEMIAYLSAYYELAPGDLIMSGTPAGVGPTTPGDVLRVQIEGLPELSVTVTDQQ